MPTTRRTAPGACVMPGARVVRTVVPIDMRRGDRADGHQAEAGDEQVDHVGAAAERAAVGSEGDDVQDEAAEPEPEPDAREAGEGDGAGAELERDERDAQRQGQRQGGAEDEADALGVEQLRDRVVEA